MYHHVLSEIVALRDLARLVVNKLRVKMSPHWRSSWLVQMVVILEGFLVCQLCVYLNLRGTRHFFGMLSNTFVLPLCGSLSPERKELRDISHAVIRIK